MPDYSEISRFIALVLRHKPQQIGLSIDYNGAWADVGELISKINSHSRFRLDMPTLENIVATDDKHRYSFNDDKSKIRANHGHSINVSIGYVPQIPPEILYHGTAERFLESIYAQGLRKMSRLYVHLSADVETARKVALRHGKPFIFKVLAGEMSKQGYEFYHAETGVWLTECVHVQFLVGFVSLRDSFL